jgi:hypothetical protein
LSTLPLPPLSTPGVTNTHLSCTSGLCGFISPYTLGKAIDRLAQIVYISF